MKTSATVVKHRVAAAFLLVLLGSPLFLGLSCATAEEQVCDAKDGSCQASVNDNDNDNGNDPFDNCALWLAESSIPFAGLGAYAGKNFKVDDRVGPPDIMIPWFDHDKRQWSQWHDFVWNGDISSSSYFENDFLVDAILPGLGAHVNCHMGLINIDTGVESKDSAGKHRSRDPMVGSFSYWHNYTKVAKRDIVPGEELFISYGEHWFLERAEHIGHVPLTDDFIKADIVGAQLLEDKATLPEEVYAMLRNVSEPRVQNALPQSLGELERIFDAYEERVTARASVPNSIRSPEWLKKNGYCVDRLYAANSTIPSAGRGAFSKIPFSKGDLISMSPTIHFKKADLQSEMQFKDEETGEAYFNGQPGYKQLMTNYVFGHEESNVVLVPYAPMVNLINHNSKEPNAYIRWAKESSFFLPEFLHMTARELLQQHKTGLMIEYIASREIKPGDEIFLDYGKAWEEAYETFLKQWQERKDAQEAAGNDDASYISAENYNLAHESDSIRTMIEQDENPYPDNLQTACFYSDDRDFNIMEDVPEEQWEMVDDEFGRPIRIVRNEWKVEMKRACQRPCTILARETMANGTEFYKAAMEAIGNDGIPPYCKLDPHEKHIVTMLPRSAIQIANQAYTSDYWIRDIFRQMIHVPEGLYPDNWMTKKRSNDDPGDFVIMDLDTLREFPGIQHLRWNDAEEHVVAEYALEAAIPEKLINTLLDFCDQSGITAKFKDLVLSPNQALDEGTDDFENLGGMDWYIQRPQEHWNSNMHWISPGGAEAHEKYLSLLGEGGFEEVLENLGLAMQLDGLVCFHVTFIGVSKCNRGYMHHDFSGTNGSGFNVIIPLIVADNTPPELYVRDDHEMDRVGGYKYRLGAASVVGDSAFHATAEVDYIEQQEFRMAATIYVADVNEENVDEILKDYTQHYPPPDPELLLKQAGAHWGKGHLPKRAKD